MLLNVEDLQVQYRTNEGNVHAVNNVDFELEEGEIVGLVGESGCGKTTFAKSLIRLLADNGHVSGGSVEFKGRDLTEFSDKQLRKEIRWKEISMIPQTAMNSLDPVYTVGKQFVQVIRTHEPDTSKAEARERTRELFERVGLQSDRIDDYPHQFSGGMAQRAMVALALTLKPSIILADEPTTALDVVMQDRILQFITDLKDEINSSILMITHDMSVVSETCDKIAVMYGGKIIEYADTETIIERPRHPYTRGMRNSFPDITKESQELISIPGVPPDLVEPEAGCQFAPRCPFAEEECWEVTPEPQTYGDHIVECHRADEYDLIREKSEKRETWDEMKERLREPSETAVTTEGSDD